jgi:hypothetical protein
MLRPEHKRELAIDSMASWALEGMEPDRETVEDINAYVDGRITLAESIEKSKQL